MRQAKVYEMFAGAAAALRSRPVVATHPPLSEQGTCVPYPLCVVASAARAPIRMQRKACEAKRMAISARRPQATATWGLCTAQQPRPLCILPMAPYECLQYIPHCWSRQRVVSTGQQQGCCTSKQMGGKQKAPPAAVTDDAKPKSEQRESAGARRCCWGSTVPRERLWTGERGAARGWGGGSRSVTGVARIQRSRGRRRPIPFPKQPDSNKRAAGFWHEPQTR